MDGRLLDDAERDIDMNKITIRSTLLLLQSNLLLLRHDASEGAGDDLDSRELEDGWRAAEVWENQLHAVGAAIARLDDGSYGTCVGCGQPISELVLATAPMNTHCEECAPTEVLAASKFTVSRGWADQPGLVRR